MGYVVEGDGVVRFTCRGCGNQATTRSLKALPKGWCLSGILGMEADPESEAVVEQTDPQALHEAATTLADHFCKVKCGKKYLSKPEIVERVKQLGVMLVLWGQCVLVVDGTPPRKEDREISAAVFGDEDDGGSGGEAAPDKRKKKHIDEDGKERPGSPPPYKSDGGPPI
jgi:hypothetical protein